jgi:hypothetical protein
MRDTGFAIRCEIRFEIRDAGHEIEITHASRFPKLASRGPYRVSSNNWARHLENMFVFQLSRPPLLAFSQYSFFAIE